MIVKAGDTHAIQWKANVDLTGASVRIIARPRRGSGHIVLEAAVTDGPGGMVTHVLSGELSPGTYLIELQATRDGRLSTFPNDGYATLTVKTDLD